MAWAGKAPMVVRMRYVQGGRMGGKPVSAANYARYIAEREGVAKVEGEAAADPAFYAGYMAERPGSTGLFGADSADPPALEEVQRATAAAPWWQDWVVSMRSPDAQQAGLRSPQDWREMVRRSLPQVAHARGVEPEGLRWAAAMHAKAGQPHVHILVWPVDAKAEAAGPALTLEQMRAAKKVFAREVFGAARADLAARRTATRDRALRVAAGAMRGEGLAPTDKAELDRRLARLAEHMPGHGRVALGYMPPKVRQEARDLADWLLQRRVLAAGAAEVERLAGALAEQRAGTEQGVAAGKRARVDLRDRVAQVVLRGAVVGQGEDAEQAAALEAAEDAGAPLEAADRGASAPEAAESDALPPEAAGGPPHRDAQAPVHHSREEQAALRAEMRRRDPAAAMALAAGTAGGVTAGALAATPAMAAAEHAALTAAMRRVVVVSSHEEGRDGRPRLRLEATGPGVDEALAILARVAPTSDAQGLLGTLAWQCARLQGLRFSDEPIPPTPADALAAKVGVKLTDQQRAQWTALLRTAGAHRDSATGRIEADTAAIQAAARAGGGAVDGTEAAIAAYRQREADWREERRSLSDEDALKRCGVTATAADLLAVRLVRDQETQAMRAAGHEALLRALPADADRALAEKEIVRQAAAAQRAEARARAEAETDPVRVLAVTLGLRLSPEDAPRLATLLRRCDVCLDEAGQWPVANGAAFREAVALVKSAVPPDSLFDLAGEAARAAARVQGLWADQQGQAIDALAVVAGKEPDAVRAALRGLPAEPGAAQAELARRLGVQPTAALTEALARVPEWLKEPERSPAARLVRRLGVEDTPEAEAQWAGQLRALEVYRAEGGALAAGDQAALDAAVAAAPGGDKARGAIVQAAWRQDREALFEARRVAWEATGRARGGVRQAQALAAWAGRSPLTQAEQRRWRGLLADATQGKPQAEDALVWMLCQRPEAGERLRAQVQDVVREQRLWSMRPVDALAERLGATWDDRTRHEVDGLLRRLPLQAKRPKDQDAWQAAEARVWCLAPSATRREVRRAMARDAARAQRTRRVDWGHQAVGVFAAARSTIERAKAEGEYAALIGAEEEARHRGEVSL